MHDTKRLRRTAAWEAEIEKMPAHQWGAGVESGLGMMSFLAVVRSSAAAIAVVAIASVSFTSASAESLTDALARAYRTNPTLKAERARQRATDELVPQALSGWRPVVSAQGSIETTTASNKGPFGRSREISSSESVSIGLSQPVFRGFKTVNSVKKAEANVEAGRQSLLVSEQVILFDAVQAYANVLRDRQILSLRQRNVSFLQEQLRAANERFNVGEITRTDVAQARSSLAQARSSLAQAEANLGVSVAAYVKTIGREPGKLSQPKLARLPKSLSAAQKLAAEINPNILASAYNQLAAEYDIEVIRGDLLPELSIEANAQLTNNWGNTSQYNSRSAQIQGVLTVPLYEGGRVYSAVRQAKQVESQRRLQIVESGRGVREGVSNSWTNYVASTKTISAARTQVEAARVALDGVQQEYLVGSRTTLDVLNAQSVLVSARITLISAQRDQLVASYQILGSIGKLTARNLRLPVQIYDVEENYLNVRNKWIGTGANTVE
jgi:TolC family type I secretion outer membrane protein